MGKITYNVQSCCRPLIKKFRKTHHSEMMMVSSLGLTLNKVNFFFNYSSYTTYFGEMSIHVLN